MQHTSNSHTSNNSQISKLLPDRGPFVPPFMSMSDIVGLHAQSRPKDIAFADVEQQISWREFNLKTNILANALISAGLQPGDRVVILTGNTVWAYVVVFGVMKAGGVACPLSTLLTAQNIAGLAQDCDADVMFVDRHSTAMGVSAQKSYPALNLIFEAGPDKVEDEEYAQAHLWCAYDTFTFDASDLDPYVSHVADDRCNVIYSSGTTGKPKGIVHSHGARVGFASELAIGMRFHAQCRTLVTTAPSSNGSWVVMLPTILVGGTTLVMGAFDTASFFHMMKIHQPTHAFMVPTQARALLADPEHKKAKFKKFECIVTAGAPMPDPIKNQIREISGEKLYELWGFTESVGTLISPTEMITRPHSVGRAWVGCELKIIDEDGNDITGKGSGEIVGRTVSMMEGYLNRPDANYDIIWKNNKGHLFLRTGDIGEIDDEGYLTLRGRSKDMILSGGLNIFPVDIESKLLWHDAVQDASVIGVEDVKWGETPVAFVILKKGMPYKKDVLMAWLNDQLAKYQRVSDLVVKKEDFPRNALGKVLKATLKKQYHKNNEDLTQANIGFKNIVVKT
ncbi:MAG: acyl--CoA ligase [Agarilytica sp.]